MDINELIEIEAIKRLKYKYLRCLDQKLWDEIVDCFTADATAAYSDGRYSFEGRDAIVDFIRTAMGAPTMLSSHRVHHPEIEFSSPTEAKGIWALEDVVIETNLDVTISGAAFYEDEYRKEDDGAWRLVHTGYRRTFEQMEPRSQRPGLQLTARAWPVDAPDPPS